MFVIGSVNIDINIDEIVKEVLSLISEEYNNSILESFNNCLSETENFIENNETEIDYTEKFIIRRIAERLLEN